MQPRSLKQILSELKAVSPFRAQEQAIRKRIGSLGSELRDDETNVLNRIRDESLQAAQSRGVGIAAGGIPLREAAELSAPALADLRRQNRDRRFSLEDALASAQSSLLDSAMGIREAEASRAFTAEQNALNRAAQQRAASAASGAQFQPIIEQLRAQIKALQGGQVRGAQNGLGIIQDPNTGKYLDTQTGRELFAQKDDRGRTVFLGGF